MLVFTILGQPEVQALQELYRGKQECIYMKKEEEQNISLEEVLPQKAADECR